MQPHNDFELHLQVDLHKISEKSAYNVGSCGHLISWAFAAQPARGNGTLFFCCCRFGSPLTPPPLLFPATAIIRDSILRAVLSALGAFATRPIIADNVFQRPGLDLRACSNPKSDEHIAPSGINLFIDNAFYTFAREFFAFHNFVTKHFVALFEWLDCYESFVRIAGNEGRGTQFMAPVCVS
jgi:hypothetical protein